MDRREFLAFLGIGAATAVCSQCLTGCKKSDAGVTAPTSVDFTLDLTNSAYATLRSVGGYVYNNGVIVAHAPTGYIAVSSTCTHQGATVQYELGSNSFYCPAHGSRFAAGGAVLNGPASNPLAKYNATLNGNSLRVFS